MFGAPTLNEVYNQQQFNKDNVEWLKPENYFHWSRYDYIPVDKFLTVLEKLGINVDWHRQRGFTLVSQVLFSQMDYPLDGEDVKFQKALDYFEVQKALA